MRRFPAALAALVLAAPAARADESEAQVLVRQGQRLEGQGKHALAAELYRAALELAPSDAEAHRLLGENLYLQNKCDEAAPTLRRYVALAPAEARSGERWDLALEHLAVCLSRKSAPAPATTPATGLDVQAAVAAPPPPPLPPLSFAPPATSAPEPLPPLSFDPVTPAAPIAREPAPPAPAKPTVLVLAVEGTGWSCRLDGAGPHLPNAAGEIALETTPGSHLVRCERPDLEPYEDTLPLTQGRRHLLRVPAIARAGGAAPPPATEASATRFVLHGGIGPGLGTVGLGVGVRAGGWEAVAGSGLYPFALSVTHLSNPGATGLYVTGGYVRVAPGVVFGGSAVRGHGAFAGLGFELRPQATMAWRIGIGVGANSAGTDSGPLTLDVAAVFLP